MILRGAKKKVIAAAIALGMVGTSMGVLSGTAQAASGDMTIAQYSYIVVGTLAEIDPACTNAGTNTGGDWVASGTPDLACQATAGCIGVSISATNTDIDNLGSGNAEMTLSGVTIGLDGTAVGCGLGVCTISLTGARTLYSSDYTGSTSYAGTFTEQAPNPLDNTHVGAYSLSNCSPAFTTLVNDQLGGNPELTTYFEVSVAA